MQTADSVIDVISCNAATSACEKSEQWQQVLELLAAMQKADIALDLFESVPARGVITGSRHFCLWRQRKGQRLCWLFSDSLRCGTLSICSQIKLKMNKKRRIPALLRLTADAKQHGSTEVTGSSAAWFTGPNARSFRKPKLV